MFLIAFRLFSVANCQTPYWQQQVNYKINVSLNDVENTLDGYIWMDYYNNSPDTLHFIWVHLWPNAYKNDRTAFADQSLENGSTAFYFSNNDQRGYINRLDFKVNSIRAKTEDHSLYPDIIKLILPLPIAPKTVSKIETPFHIKLPYSFSRGGHIAQAYHITQWYPKPAVYDNRGWHPIPYLDQGEFYSEFGNYEVQITLPENYVVAATGELQEPDEKRLLLQKNKPPALPEIAGRKNIFNWKKETTHVNIPSSPNIKTIHFKQENVHDFAWFADKEFLVDHDTLKLPSGSIIDLYSFYYPKDANTWKKSNLYIKQALLSKSKWVGEYPYHVVSVVDDAGKESGGMEYPTITLLASGSSERSLDMVINHEVGHNWFYGILASNERSHPWMDEGMNTYYDLRYSLQQYGDEVRELPTRLPVFIKNKMPEAPDHLLLQTIIGLQKDQPIETPSEKFNFINYNLVSYTKTGEWMNLLETVLGRPLFDSCMREYYRRWQFRHPYPEDFKRIIADVSSQNVEAVFSLLDKKGSVKKNTEKKDIRFSLLFNFKETDKHQYIFFSPAVGVNYYDKLMFGALFHNYTLPLSKLNFIVAPLYGTKSKQLNGIGRISYSLYQGNNGQKAILSLSAASFNSDSFTDSTNFVTNLRFSKIVPAFKYVFSNKDPRSTITQYLQWKTFLITETKILFNRDTVRHIDIINYPKVSRYVNQLQFVLENNRILYPYKGIIQVEQADGFIRTDFNGNYFFNFPSGGGMNVRLFAGKFFYLGDKTITKQFTTDAYHLNLTGPKGFEDYTYSNYFIGRNEYDKFPSKQIMIRDGGFKIRTDLLSNKVGKTDDWLAAINFTSDIPAKINPFTLLPFKLPLKLFMDIGTFSEAWKKNPVTGHFIYDAGIQLSLFKDIINVYLPVLYSKVYQEYIKSTIPENQTLKTLVFSIDLQHITLRKFIPQLPL